jgi:hypothetical protein
MQFEQVQYILFSGEVVPRPSGMGNNYMTKTALLSAVLLLSCGCIMLPIPHNEYVQPEISGTILDSASKAPIMDAHVVFNNSSKTLSDEKGEFHLSGRYDRKVWMVLAADPSSSNVRVLFSHPDYETKIINKRIFRREKKIEFNAVYLKRVSSGQN